jgi:uncharacterized protein involved in response to NO
MAALAIRAGRAGRFAWSAWAGLSALFLFCALWQAGHEAYGAFILPSPAATLRAVAGLLREEANWAIAASTTGRALEGFLVAALAGTAAGTMAGYSANLVLDPSLETSPYRPHPGRQNLASGLVAIALAGELAGLSTETRGYLCLAAGAAFLDRAGEAFIGRSFRRAEMLGLFGCAALAGLGLIALGAARLGAPLPESTGLNIALMGRLGLGVLAVFSIAGLLHTGRPLRLPPAARLSFLLLAAAAAVRVAPDLGVPVAPPGGHHAASAVVWGLAFLTWLYGYWPLLSDAGRDRGAVGRRAC